MDNVNALMDKLRPYKLRLVLTLLALLVAILLFSIGFFKTIFLLIIVGIGYAAGVYFDDPGKFVRWIEKFKGMWDN